MCGKCGSGRNKGDGKVYASSDGVVRLAKVLNTNVEYLISGEHSAPQNTAKKEDVRKLLHNGRNVNMKKHTCHTTFFLYSYINFQLSHRRIKVKKQILLLSLIFALGASIWAKPNYKNGNGTILSQKKRGNTVVTVRKFELSLEFGDLAQDGNIYSEPTKSSSLVIGHLTHYGIEINITQLITIEFPEDKTQVWYKISSPQQGYILGRDGGLNVLTDPYFENNSKSTGLWANAKMSYYCHYKRNRHGRRR